mgnify:CR=1 FL=1
MFVYNYYTNSIKINDRFVFGTMNPEDRENNTVYKVKAVFKADTKHTFTMNRQDEIESTPLVILGLDKDLISPDDDFVNRIASQAPIYKVVNTLPHDIPGMTDDGTWSIDFVPIVEKPKKSLYTIRMGNGPKEYIIGLYKNGILEETFKNFTYTYILEYMDEGFYGDYFSHTENGNIFTITCNDDYSDGDLLVTAVCTIPSTGEELKKTYRFKLKGLG